jgi:hypothetical protein
VSSQKSLLSTVKREASRKELLLGQEVRRLRKKVRLELKDKVALAEQLKLSEEQITQLMQYAPEEDDTFTGFDLRQLVEHESADLELESHTMEFAYEPCPKRADAWLQTEPIGDDPRVT